MTNFKINKVDNCKDGLTCEKYLTYERLEKRKSRVIKKKFTWTKFLIRWYSNLIEDQQIQEPE